jgi:hypothetical protein
MFISSRRTLCVLAPLALAAALLGCRSADNARNTSTPQQDFQTFRQLVVSGIAQLDAALDALDGLSAQANRDARPAYQTLVRALETLEVESVKVRERTQAMRTRGDAYFEHWEEWLTGANDQAARRRAGEHREELQRSFEAVRAASQQVREGFRPFLTDLQKVCVVLEKGPTLARINAHKSLIMAADEKGTALQRNLDKILAEMNTMTALLKEPETTDNR